VAERADGFPVPVARCGTDGACCTAIPGATAKTYALVAADAGHTMRARVTAVNADGAANARTAPTAVVSSPGSPKNADRPTVSGEAKVGEELAAEPGRCCDDSLKNLTIMETDSRPGKARTRGASRR
jgi:hypothetical protein